MNPVVYQYFSFEYFCTAPAQDWRLVSREDVRGDPSISEKTLATFAEYWRCGGCQKAC